MALRPVAGRREEFDSLIQRIGIAVVAAAHQRQPGPHAQCMHPACQCGRLGQQPLADPLCPLQRQAIFSHRRAHVAAVATTARHWPLRSICWPISRSQSE